MTTPEQESESILIFSVAEMRFCVNMQLIESVLEYQSLSHLPNEPAWIAGGFWHQGDYAHVINVRKKFALPDSPEPESGSFITAYIDDELFAFWVDRVEDVTDAEKHTWKKLPRLNSGVFNRVILQEQQMILEVDFYKLKKTESLNVTNFVNALSTPVKASITDEKEEDKNFIKNRRIENHALQKNKQTTQKPKKEHITTTVFSKNNIENKTNTAYVPALPEKNKPEKKPLTVAKKTISTPSPQPVQKKIEPAKTNEEKKTEKYSPPISTTTNSNDKNTSTNIAPMLVLLTVIR